MSRSGRVLLIEGDKFLRGASEASLRQRGLDVVIAVDGAEGLRLARTEPRADVILLDLLLPRLPGLDVLRALKGDPATSGIPVVILSNSSRDEDKQHARELGAAGYYGKANLSLKKLAARVEHLVRHAVAGCPHVTAPSGDGGRDEPSSIPKHALEPVPVDLGATS